MQKERNRLVFGQPIPDDPFIGGRAALYERFARSQENRSWFGLEMPVLRYILERYPRNTEILEIGVGAGNLMSLLLEMGFDERKISAVEPNRTLQALYSKRFPNVRIHSAYMNELAQCLDSQFSLILAHMVVNHVPTQMLVESLHNVFLSLTDEGEFICVLPNPLEKVVKYDINTDDIDATVTETAPWGGTVTYHHRSEMQLLAAFNEAGFTHVEVFFRPTFFDPLNVKNDFQRVMSPYFLKEHSEYSGLPTRIVVKARK